MGTCKMRFGHAKLANKAMTTNRIDITITGIQPFKGFPGNQESPKVESPKKYLSDPEIFILIKLVSFLTADEPF